MLPQITSKIKSFFNFFKKIFGSGMFKNFAAPIFLFTTGILRISYFYFTYFYKICAFGGYVNLKLFNSQIMQILCKTVDNLCLNLKIRLVFVDNFVDMWIICLILFKYYNYVSRICAQKLCHLSAKQTFKIFIVKLLIFDAFFTILFISARNF